MDPSFQLRQRLKDQTMSLRNLLLATASTVVFGASLPGHASVVLTDSETAWLNDIGGAELSVGTSTLGANKATTSNISLNGGVSVATSQTGTILQVGNGWSTWSGGYTGQVLAIGPVQPNPVVPTSVTLRPSGTYALGFEAEPNSFSANLNVTVTLATGQTLTDSVSGIGGAQFFGYVGAGVTSLTVSSPGQFAIGNFKVPTGAAALDNAVAPYVANANGSPNPNGVAVFANFTPNDGLSLSQAAADMGYTGFDWQQTITNWPNANLQPANGTTITPVPPNQPFLDPPLSGYTYNPCGGKAPGAAGTAHPFYFNPTPSSDCWSVSQNETGSPPNTLSFGDEPMDHELTQADVNADNIPKFTTDLVGILPGDVPGPDLFEWTWVTTYNGAVGGASRSANIVQGVGGTGHAFITSIDGVPAAVPEPPALFLLASGILAMLSARKAADWNRTRYRSN